MSELVWDRVPLVGRRLIEASAGTGKTYTITTLVLRLLLERRLRLEQILVVTFTRAAAAELRERIRRRLRAAVAAFEAGPSDSPEAAAPVDEAPGDEVIAALVARSPDREGDRRHLLGSLRELDEAPIATLHGFCARVLREHGLEHGAPLAGEPGPDDGAIATALVADLWGREVVSAPATEVRRLRHRAPFDTLVKLACDVSARPELTVVPAPGPVDTAPSLAAFAAAQADARRVWAASRAEILALLVTHPGLNRSRYRAAWIPSWAAQVDLLLASPPPVADDVVQAAQRFTPQSLAKGTKKGQSPPEHPAFPRLEAVLAANEVAGAALDAWVQALEHRVVERARAAVAVEKRRAGVVTFDDLLLVLRAALRSPTGDRLARELRARYPAALIDEFQDTDPVQYEILERIYGDPSSTLFLIGDPKQAIYSFRGADVFAYLAAARAVGGEPDTLAVSYRSDPRLVAAINRLFSRAERPFLLDGIRYRPVAPRPGATERLATREAGRAALELVFTGSVPADGADGADGLDASVAADAQGLLAATAAEVVRWLGAGATIDGVPLRATDLAVLTARHWEAEAVQAMLSAHGVPSVLYGERSVLDSPEAFEVALVVAALAEPARGRRVRAALATRLIGVDGAELAALSTDEGAGEAWIERFVRWHERWRTRGFAHAFRALVHELDVIPRLLGEPGGERRLTNVLHLAELLHDAATTRHLGPDGLARWFTRARHDASAREVTAAEAMQVRLESDADAVRVVTMHRSKGLEYPIVIAASLAKEAGRRRRPGEPVLYHDPAAGHRPHLHLGGVGLAAAVEAADEEALAEGLRLAYVAITRARHQVVVITQASAKIVGSPLGYLLHDRGPAAADGAGPEGERGKATAAALVAELERVAGDDPAVLRVRPAAPVAGPALCFPPAEELSATVRPVTRRFPCVRRVTSYTGLVGHAPSTLELERPGDDELIPPRAPPEPAAPAPEPVPLFAFPRGAGPGNALHAVLERVDFPTYDPAASLASVQAALERHGIDSAAWGEVVANALGGVLATPLAAAGPRLCDLAPGTWRSEVEFTLPVRPDAAGSAANSPLLPAELARVLAEQGGGALPGEYPARIAALGFAGLAGYLRGFIDLVFEHGGRFYVVDYKSNHLGDRPGDYAPSALALAMAEHHYFLQAYLYSVALHRHLAARQPGYDFDRDFGGIYYLFLRGMSPEQGPRAGVYAARPPRGLIEGLSRVLGGALAEGAP